MGMGNAILFVVIHLLLTMIDIVIVFLFVRAIVPICPNRWVMALDHAGSRVVDEVTSAVRWIWTKAISYRRLSAAGCYALSLVAVLCLRLLISMVAAAFV
jgi:hypothetical protein